MRNRDTLFIGLMLFALFFGAGNLIYPPYLGLEAGPLFWPAMIGFIITGVGLPVVALAAIARVKGGAEGLANRVHPLFSIVFISIVYLAIGPLFAIPRAATVAYEIGVRPFVSGGSFEPYSLLVFSLIFFSFVYIVSLNPSKIVDRIGQWLTPALLIAIISLAVTSLFKLDGAVQEASDKYQAAPFFTGFLEGYLTMDTIGALAFGIIVITAIKEKGVRNDAELVKHCITAGVIAGVGLAVVYGAIGFMGVNMASYGPFENGSAILSTGADLLFGASGKLLLGFIVLLACFTTAVGLTVACSQFVTKKTATISYKATVTVIVLFSLLVSNLGLNKIISLSIPILVIVYPITIVLIFLALGHRLFGGRPFVYRGAILLTSIVSIFEGIAMFGLEITLIKSLISVLPFADIGLAWLVPAFAGAIAGYVVQIKHNDKQTTIPEEKAA